MLYSIMPRSMIGLGDPVNNDGKTTRPLLNKNLRWITVHYTGSQGKYGDPGDTEAEIKAIQAYAIAAKKSYEYNYVIGMDENQWVYEYAGNHMAAHSAGENDESYGILMLNGISEALTATQIDKFRWLTALLKFVGAVKPDVEIRQHNQMPGAATACPGTLIKSVWSDLLKPYTPPTLYKACKVEVLSGEGYIAVARRLTGIDPPPQKFVDDLITVNDNRVLQPGVMILVPGYHGTT